MPIVADSTTLIWLAKISKLWLLKDMFALVYVSKEVFRETIEEGISKGYSDAVVIKRAIEERWIIVEDINWSDLAGYRSLGRGELSSMGFHLRGQMWAFIHEGFGHHRDFPSHARKKVPPHPRSPGPHPFLYPAVAQQGSSEGHPAHSRSLVDWPEGLVFMFLLLCWSPRASLCFRAMKNTEAQGLLQ